MRFTRRGNHAGMTHDTTGFSAWDASRCAKVADSEDEDDPPTLPPTPTVPSVNPNGYPVLGQDVSCTYVFNPLGGDPNCVTLSFIGAEGWYYEIRLGVSIWFASNGDGTVSATACMESGSRSARMGTGKPAPSG